MNKKEKLIIYQMFPRILTNDCMNPEPWGSIERNGCGKINDITPRLLRSIHDLGVNCIWYTGIIEHATKTCFPGIERDNVHVVKGEAGSPYAISDYYDVAPELATNLNDRISEFEALVDRTHKAGMKVLIDFVPNHTARQYHSDAKPEGVEDFGVGDNINMNFSPYNDYYYITNQQFSPTIPLGTGADSYREFPAKATGNDCFTAFPGEYDWYETVKLNYGHDYSDGSNHFDPHPKLWNKMLDILIYWASKGIDGFRCDMVFMVPRDFWHWAIREVKKIYPDIIFIGEIYDVSIYHDFLDYCGFDYLYDKVNLYDTLVGIERHGFSAAQLTGCWQTVDGIADSMLNFLENHDEVRYASKEFAGDSRKVTPALVTSAMISRGPFMIYYGQELGEAATDNEGFAGNNNRSTIFDYWSYASLRSWNNNGRWNEKGLNEQQRWLRGRYSRVLQLCNSEAAISQGGFFDLMYANLQNQTLDPHTTFAFIRYTAQEQILIITNFGDSAVSPRLNIPELAFSMCGLPIGECQAIDLLTGKKLTLNLCQEGCGIIPVDAHDAIILKVIKNADDSNF